MNLSAVPEGARELFGDAFDRACQYADILSGRGVEWGLIGPREQDRIWSRHILNSVAIASYIQQGCSVVDVGSGAGLPGIPLALVRPDLRITLLEPLQRRAAFLELAVAELGLGDRVSVVRARAEDRLQVYDVVTCRAVADIKKLLAWTSPLLGAKGSLIALKGQRVHQELTDARAVLKKAHLEAAVDEVVVLPGEQATCVLRIAKILD